MERVKFTLNKDLWLNRLQVLFLFLLIFAQGVKAQQRGLTIAVKDVDGIPIVNVPVKLTTCNHTYTIKTNRQGEAITDKEVCANTRLTISSKFYVTKDTLLSEVAPHVTITLRPNIQEIDEVSVKAYRQMAQSDAEKTIYTINKDGFLKNTRANQVLQFLPGVTVVGNTYKLQGRNQNARVKIDGVDATVDDLKTVDIADIAHVEVKEISPDDNSSTAGVINIVRKRQEVPKLYTSLSGTENLIHRILYTYDIFQFQSKQWDLNMNINYVGSNQKSVSSIDRYYTDGTPDEHIHEHRTNDANQFLSYLKMGYYPVSGKYQITARLSYDFIKTDIFAHSEHDNGVLWQKKAKEKTDSYQGLINMVYNWDKSNSLTLKGNAVSYKYIEDASWYESKMLEYTGEAVSEHNHVKWLGGDNVTIGFKTVFRSNRLSSAERWSYTTHRFYLADFHKWGKRWSTYLILKGETDNMGTTRKYDFLPSLKINYNMGKCGYLSAYYQRNVMRPSVDYQNADTLYVSDYKLKVGNMGLGYEHRDNFTLSYNRQIKTSFLTFSLSYEHRKDIIGEACMDPDNYNVYTYENLGDGKIARLTARLTQRLAKNRLNLSLTIGGLYHHYNLRADFDGLTTMAPVHGWGYSALLNSSYLSTRGWQYSLTLVQNPWGYSLNTQEYKHPMVMGSVSKYVWKSHLKLSLNFMNPLVYNWSSRSETMYKNMRQHFSRKMYMNEVSVSATLYLGKQFRNRQEASEVDNNDLQLRL